MGIGDNIIVSCEIVGYRWSPGLQVKERTWKMDPEGTLFRIDLWRNATFEEIGDYEHKRNVPEEEREIRKAWYRAGVYAFNKCRPIDWCLGASVNGTGLTPERARSFKAGWRFAASNPGTESPYIPRAPEIYARELLGEFYNQPYQKENTTMKINVKDHTEIGKLAYGTYVTGITSHPSIVYQKIDKRNPGRGITLDVPKHHSVLMNVELGSLRIVPGDTLVSVYEAELNLSRTTNFGPYLKDNIF